MGFTTNMSNLPPGVSPRDIPDGDEDEVVATRWKGGELAYCIRVVSERGNQSVPAHLVPGYLDVQGTSALRDRLRSLSSAFYDAARVVRNDAWDIARQELQWAYDRGHDIVGD